MDVLELLIAQIHELLINLSVNLLEYGTGDKNPARLLACIAWLRYSRIYGTPNILGALTLERRTISARIAAT